MHGPMVMESIIPCAVKDGGGMVLSPLAFRILKLRAICVCTLFIMHLFMKTSGVLNGCVYFCGAIEPIETEMP